MICFYCGNKGHYIKECIFKNFNKRDGANKVNMVKNDEVKKLVAIVSNFQIRMIIELNTTTTIMKNLD